MTFQVLLLLISGSGLFSCEQKPTDLNLNSGPAVVTAVVASGTDNNYTFSVTLKSPDTGCKQYADWREVITADGSKLLTRRILVHSHIDEQPFMRTGGPINISSDTEVIIWGHMSPLGYGEGGIIMKGTVATGFIRAVVVTDFATSLEGVDPQPTGCAF